MKARYDHIFKTCRTRKQMSVILLLFLLCFLTTTNVYADKTVDRDRAGSVTIRYFDDVAARTPVAGAEFTFYKIDDSTDTTAYTSTTNQDGILRIADMKLGRYRVVETTPAEGHAPSASFLLTIPMTDDNEWIYDLTLEPKAALVLPTTTKSIYSGVGSTAGITSLSGRNSSGGTYDTAQSARRSAYGSKTSPAQTGDVSKIGFWTMISLTSSLIVLFLVTQNISGTSGT